MSDFKLKVIADTQEAQKQLREVDDSATKATKARNLKIEIPNYSDLSKNFRDLNKDVSSAANGIKDFYKVASKLPVGPVSDINQLAGSLKRVAVTATESGRNVGDAGDVIKATFNATNKAAETLVSRLTKIALGLYVIKEAAGIVQGAFSGMFNETIGREIKLRETILKTQTTLASTNKVFRNGKEITDPYQKIVTLSGAVRKNIDSIRERSIALAGVTSGEVIEVFGMVASQVGQIGGGLKEAEDLAINFAAALGTFGIPLYQARQEIGSILRGDITTDSYLAKALGITNEDIAKAKTQTGGVVKFLEERLAAAVAGQRIAAEGFSGVMSNIRDLGELISQNFGAGLLDPLLDSLTNVFNFLFSIRDELFEISRLAGKTIGTIADTAIKLIGGATGGASVPTEKKEGGQTTSKFGADDALNAAKATVNYVKVEVSKAFSTVYLQISTLLERVSSAFLAVGGGLAMLAKGLLSIKLETFKALVGAIEAVSPALLVAAKGLGAFLGLWGKFMELPLVQELAQIGAGMRALEATGVMPVIRSGFILQGVIANWGKIIGFVTTQFNALRSMIGGVIAWLGQLIAQAGRTGVALLTAWTPASKALQALRQELLSTISQLEAVGTSAQRAGGKIGGFQVNVDKAKGGLLGFVAGMIKFQLIMFAISAILSVAMERFSAYKESQDKIASDKRAQEAIRRLSTTYKNLGENATEAQKRAKAFEQSLVNQKYDEAVAGLEKIKKKLEEIRNVFGPKEGIGDNLKKGIDNVLATLNPANFDIVVKQLRGDYVGTDITSFGEALERRTLDQQKAALAELAKYSQEVNKIAAEENIKIEAQKRIDLSKEIAELERQQQNDLFQQRQTLAQKEVEIFRAAGELRIFQMEQANAKLIEGEEGASRAALEALNNYLSVRENGELEIEAAKKEIAIEVVNLEKAIADYRFENEKKIAEIRKRAGENEKAMADARRQAEAGPPVTAGEVGRTGGDQAGPTRGRSTGPHLHAQSRGMSEAELRAFIDAALIFPNGAKASQYGTSRGYTSTHGGIDYLTPQNTPYSLAPGYSARSLGVQGNLGLGQEITGPGGKKAQLGHLASARGGAAAPAAATPTPQLQSLDVLAPAADKFAAALRGIISAMGRLRLLQQELTQAKTIAAFEAIAKAAFDPVAIEGYQDSLYEAQLTYDAIAASSADAFNPERSALAVQTNVQITRSAIELQQIRDAITNREKEGLLNAKEAKGLIEGQTKAQAAYVARLREAEDIQAKTLAITQAANLIKTLKEGTAAIYDDIEAIETRNELTLKGFAPEVIEAELNKLKINKEIARETERLTTLLRTELDLRDRLQQRIATAAPKDRAELAAKLEAALATIKTLQAQLDGLPAAGAARAAAEDAKAVASAPITDPAEIIQNRINAIKREADALTNIGNMAVTVADGIGSAFSDSFKGIISGSMTARQALGNFFQSLADMFLEMAAQMIAKMIVMATLNSILGVLPGAGFAGGGIFGGGAGLSSGFSGMGSAVGGFSFFADGGAFAQNGIVPFAQGGIVSRPTLFKFANGGAMQTGLMGEAGPEAIMPLSRGANGKLGVVNVGGKGGGDTNITVNVDASGTKAQGDSDKSEQLGRAVSQAVQDELLRQKRPGGLLA